MIILEKFIEMIKGGAKILSLEYEYINDLNVFPVPDGDTGSNLKTTVNGALENLENARVTTFKQLADVFARGLLMNARGNSGVIFSQIFKGFLQSFTEDVTEITPEILRQAFLLAKQKAYNSVSNPIEGTILTVIRMMAEAANRPENSNITDINTLFNLLISVGQNALEQTIEMLQELKEVGVVDSGGYGLMSFFKGMNAVLQNKLDEEIEKAKQHLSQNSVELDHDSFQFFDANRNEDGFGYCSEIIMTLGKNINPNTKTKKKKFVLDNFRVELERIGNSLVLVQDEDLVKVHIHTMAPYRLLQIAQPYGEFEKIKIENMTNQYLEKQDKFLNKSESTKEVIKPAKEEKKIEHKLENGISLVATVPTKKIAKFYKEDFDVTYTILTETGPAPSIQIFMETLYKAGKKEAFIVTDDSNLVLAANEAANEVAADISVKIIPAKNLFESMVCVTSFDSTESFRSNYKQMTKQLKKTVSAVISTSIKDVNYSDISVKVGQKIGIIDKKVKVSCNDEFDTLKQTLDLLMSKNKNAEVCFIVCGINTSNSILKRFEKYASETYGLYCDIKNGGQKVYDYYLGIQ